jgi:hypothetical protein
LLEFGEQQMVNMRVKIPELYPYRMLQGIGAGRGEGGAKLYICPFLKFWQEIKIKKKIMLRN